MIDETENWPGPPILEKVEYKRRLTLKEPEDPTHYSKSLIFVQKLYFGKTLILEIFEFLRQNWKLFLNVST